jgi:uncharacterized protein YciI
VANFAVRLVHGPGWDPSREIRDQDGWDEHAAFMDGLVADGFIVLGGPVGNGEQTLHVVEAADEDEIRARLAGDPWASAGLLRIGTIEPWALWLDSRPWMASLAIQAYLRLSIERLLAVKHAALSGWSRSS